MKPKPKRWSARKGGVGGILFALILGGAIGAGACYYFIQHRENGNAATATRAPAPVERVTPPAAPTRPETAPASEDYIARKLREWHLSPEELKRDLASAGEVVREKGRALGDKVADATADVAIIAKIKTKFALDDRLQALKISVGCKQGHVTLSGAVAAPDLIGRAIVLALDTEDVVDVVSSLKVEKRPQPV